MSYMDIEANLSEEVWELIETFSVEQEDILDCLGMGFHVIVDLEQGIVLATPVQSIARDVWNSNVNYTLINVDTGEIEN